MIYRLLVKIHNVTGLKYLCKTIKNEWKKYPGSGTYWKRHLQQHGFNFETILLFETTDKNEFKQVAIQKSIEFDVVNSKHWANLVIEQGDGGPTMAGKKNPGRVEAARRLGLANKGRSHLIGNPLRKGQPNKYLRALNTTRRGTTWFNNGVQNTRSTVCPPGFVRGFIKSKRIHCGPR